MIIIDNQNECCGCTACMNICPVEAIKMTKDKEGFDYPQIDNNLCIKCYLCNKVCPLNIVNLKEQEDYPKVYAYKANDSEVKLKSSSGGIFTAISNNILQLNSNEVFKKDINGICFGASFDYNFNVIHREISKHSEIYKLRGSKYIQSQLGFTFNKIREYLEDEKTVLFTGTPCQVAGLKQYLKLKNCNIKNLILNDIVCHGVSSPKVWTDYVEIIEKKFNGKLIEYTFRNKKRGWHNYNILALFNNGYVADNNEEIRKFINLYNTNLILRPACYVCKYANMQRPSDITIGDFWGIEKIKKDFDDNTGISLVIVNNEKGEYLFNEIKKTGQVMESNNIDCYQHNLKEPTQIPNNRIKFWNDYMKYGFNYIDKKYASKKFIYRLRRKLFKIMNIC